MEKIREFVLAHVAGEFNPWVAGTGPFDRLDVSMRLRMIATGNDQLRVRQTTLQGFEGCDHELQALVRSPFTECKNAVLGIASAGKVGEFGPSSQSAVGTHVDIVAAVFVEQNFAIPGHEHRDGIRKQQHSRGERAGHAISARKTYSGVLQVDGIHQMVQRHVGIATAQAGKEWSHQSGERNQWIAAEGAEQQVEPDHVGLQLPERAQQPDGTCGVIERPAALDREAIQFRLNRGHLIGKDRKAQERIALKFLGDVKTILA